MIFLISTVRFDVCHYPEVNATALKKNRIFMLIVNGNSDIFVNKLFDPDK